MSAYLPEHDPNPLDRLGVLLEQLEGLVAVGTQTNFGELDEKEIRFYMYGVSDFVTRCNAAYMAHQSGRKESAQ